MRFGSSFPRLQHLVLGLVVAVLGIGVPWTACRADPEPTIELTEEERAWLNEHDVLRHVPVPDYAPVESYGSGGRPVGIAPDYLSLVAERLGMTVKTVRAPTWNAALDSMRQRHADLITVIHKTKSRSQYITFTEPYLSVPAVILVRKQVEGRIDMTDLADHTVALVEDYAVNGYLRDRYPNVRYHIVPDVETGIEKTSFGSVDAMVLALPVASAAIERTQITNLRVAGKTEYVYKFRFGVRSDRPMLRRVLAQALGSVTASRHKTIYDRWIKLEHSTSYAETGAFWYTLFSVFGGLLVLLGAGAAWNWSLQREVARRTEELRTAKAEAEEMNRLKSAFLANMNHEFRTPLTSIIGFADTLADKELKAPANRFSRHIRENGKRLLETLDSVLHLAQLEAGAMTLDPEPVAVDDEVERLVGLFREQAEQKGVQFYVEPPETALDATVDPAAFERILSNLLSNAIKFSEAGDTVTVRVGEEGSAIVVEVEDTGVGIDPDFAPKLYDAFEQESAGTDREYEGVGLGLAITRKLTELMGGTIAVKSEKGTGTRFTVRLPQEQPGIPARMAPGDTDTEWQTNGT